MPLSVTCPRCESKYQLDPAMRGKRMRCPNTICRAVFEVRDDNDPPVVVEPPPVEETPPAKPLEAAPVEAKMPEPVKRKPIPKPIEPPVKELPKPAAPPTEAKAKEPP